ncbi:hypothetical protein Tco_1095051 [Tanacetum coccineum]
MSSSTVTCTSVYSDFEPWRFQWVFEDELEAPKEAPQPPREAPPSPEYVPGPEHPPLPDYVASPEYPEYLVPSDDEAPIEDHPLPADASPTTLSPGYEDEASKEDKDVEEEHLAPSDSTTLPAIDHVPLAKRIPLPLLPLPSPPLPLPAPSSHLLLLATDRREDVPKADVLPQKRLCLTSLAPRFEVGESSVAAATRQPGLDVAHATEYCFVDTVDATPRRPMSRKVGYRIMDV